MIVFPQTTRTERFDASQFNTIGTKLACRTGVPILPLALRTDAWSNGALLKDFGRMRPERPVRFAFGAPIYPEGRGEGAQQKLIETIREALLKWGVDVG